MSWTNPDYEHDMPPYDPEPIDDDPWYPPAATGDDLSATDDKDDPQPKEHQK